MSARDKLGPSIVDGRLRYLSISQVEKFDTAVYGGCQRRWWFRYVARKREEQKAAAKAGEQIHAQIEHYLRTGEDVLGDIARAGRRLLPAPGPDLKIEWAFHRAVSESAPVESLLSVAGVPFVGYIDLLHGRPVWIDDDGVPQPMPPRSVEVGDHKSTGQIENEVDPDTGIVLKRGYAKTAEEIARSWQMTSYGIVADAESIAAGRGPLDFVRLSHQYFQTRGRRAAVKRSALVSMADVRARWAQVTTLVEAMQSCAGVTRAEDVPAHEASCQAYGGCPHKAYCPRSPRAVLAGLLGGGKADRVAALAGGYKPPALVPLRLSATAQADSKEDFAMSLIAKLKAKNAAAAAPTAPPPVAPTAPTPSPDVAAEIAALEAEERAIMNTGIAPPDQPAPAKTFEPVPEGTVLPVGVVVPAPVTAAASGPAESTPAPRCDLSSTVQALSTDEIAEKKKFCACGGTLKVAPVKMGDGQYYANLPEHHKGETIARGKAGRPKKVETSPVESAEKLIKTMEGVMAESFAPTPAKVPIMSGPHGSVILADPADATEALAAIKASTTTSTEAVDAVVETDGLTLFLDAIEDGVTARRLESYAEGLCRALESEYKAADIRCAPADSPLGFGKWKGALAALARVSPPEPGAYVVSSSSEIGLVVFDALATAARRVVRGVK